MSRKKPLDATIDSVGTALTYLFDWLGAERGDSAPDVSELLIGSEDDDADDEDEDEDEGVIDTEGESV
jgi:hypothetical protein